MLAHGFLVGISGPTCSGKTTIAAALSQSLKRQTPVIYSQDDYYYSEEDSRHARLSQFGNYINWELETAFDMKKLTKDIQNHPDPSCGILEGISIFSDSQLISHLDFRFFISLDYKTCKSRRSRRSYYPFEPDPPGYFDEIVWPSHMDYKRTVLQRSDHFHMLDGTQTIEKSVTAILDHFRKARPDIFV